MLELHINIFWNGYEDFKHIYCSKLLVHRELALFYENGREKERRQRVIKCAAIIYKYPLECKVRFTVL